MKLIIWPFRERERVLKVKKTKGIFWLESRRKKEI